MKKHLPVINLVLIVLLYIAVIYSFNKLSILFVSSAADEVVDHVGIEVVLDRIDSNFVLTVTAVTILFGFFGLVSFVGLKAGFSSQFDSLEKAIDAQKEAWSVHDRYIKSVEGDLSYDTGRSMFERSKVYWEDEEKHKIDIVEDYLVICDYFSKALIQKSDVYPKFRKGVTDTIKDLLEDADRLLKKEDGKMLLKDVGYDRYMRAEENILKIADREIRHTLDSIFLKIDFPDLE